MTDYIKRKDALDIIRKHVHANDAPITTAQAEVDLYARGLYMAQEAVKGVESAGVTPVVHGEWVQEPAKGFQLAYVCSHCHTVFTDINTARYHYCPHCGAKMDGGI